MWNKKLAAIIPGKSRYANIVWQVSDVCNFRCSYCNEGNWGGKHKNQNLDTYLKVMGEIIDYYKARDYQAFKFFFSGGEPTIWAPLLPICDFIYSKIDRPLIAVNTNLSRPLDWWQKNYSYFHDIVASFHVENTRTERYLENAEFLQYRVSYLALRLLMHDSRFSEVLAFADVLKHRLKNYTIEYAPLLQELSPQSESHFYQEKWKRDFLEKFNYETKRAVPFSLIDTPNPAYSVEVYEDGEQRSLNSNRVVAEENNFFQGWKCWINDNIFINPSGDITLASCGVAGKVGNMNEGWIRFLDEPILCPKTRCNCGTDICIPKVRPDRLGSIRV